MNAEQAYIEGFVKRANEYGLDKEEAVGLLKEATTFGATKKLLRLLKSEGVELHRTPQSAAKNVAFPGMSIHQSQNLMKKYLKQQGPIYMPAEKKIFVPRGDFKPTEKVYANSRMNEYGHSAAKGSKPLSFEDDINIPTHQLNLQPRTSLFHEAGHALHAAEDLPGITYAFNNPHTDSQLAAERIANNNAINFMRQNNVPRANVDKFIRDIDHTYSSYLNPNRALKDMNSLGSSQYVPGHGV